MMTNAQAALLAAATLHAARRNPRGELVITTKDVAETAVNLESYLDDRDAIASN